MGEKDGEQIGGNLEAECHVVLLLERAAAHPRNRATRTKAWQKNMALAGLENCLLPQQDTPAMKSGSPTHGQGNGCSDILARSSL